MSEHGLEDNDAASVEIALRWLGVPFPDTISKPSTDQFRVAIQWLADSLNDAYKRRGFGRETATHLRPEDVRQAVEDHAARLDRWAQGQEGEDWRVVHLANAQLAEDQQYWEVWSQVGTLAEAQADLANEADSGWVDPHIQHRHWWAGDWERVE